jgi:hypothetical protein
MHVEQFFFAKDARLSKNWKIVLYKEVTSQGQNSPKKKT